MICLFASTISRYLIKLNIISINITGTSNYHGPGLSPDSMGAVDVLNGCVSTPSSEALDQVSDLRHSRTLPKRGGIISIDNVDSNGIKVKQINLCYTY